MNVKKTVFTLSKKAYALFYRMIDGLRKKILYMYMDGFIKSQYKKLSDKKKLTKEQKREIQGFYKNIIGKKISLYSHEYFYSRTGIYSKEYIPKSLHEIELIPKANKITKRHKKI